jgi:hypothetical protein
MEHRPSETVSSLTGYKKFTLYLRTQSALPRLTEPATGLHHGPVESSPHSLLLLILRSITMRMLVNEHLISHVMQLFTCSKRYEDIWSAAFKAWGISPEINTHVF